MKDTIVTILIIFLIFAAVGIIGFTFKECAIDIGVSIIERTRDGK